MTRLLPLLLLAFSSPAAAAHVLGTAPANAKPCLHPERADALARQYAPTLSFAKGEQSFPTIPFFTAFAVRPGPDLRPDDMGPLAIDGSRISWDRLLERYSKWDDGRVLPPRSRNAVFFRTRCLQDAEVALLQRFLRKDAQAWRRGDMDRRWALLDAATHEFAVAEYYFYYITDTGLEGHPEDIEFVFVFMPNDISAAASFRVIVGGGHSSRTPNGVRVVLNDSVAPNHIWVELGGHASSPASRAVDSFVFGTDINWHVADTWGPRDLMAVSGLGFSGNYRPEMTFERAKEHVMPPDTQNPDSGYKLLPVEPFRVLSQALSGGDADSISTAFRAAHAVVWPDPPPGTELPESLPDSVIRRMKLWNETLDVMCECPNPASRHQIWEHRHYRFSPVTLLKDHLYRPSSFRPVSDLLTWGVSNVPSQELALTAGIVLPILSVLPVYVPGFVEVQAGIAMHDDGWLAVRPRSWVDPEQWRFTARATYHNSYLDHVTWYASAIWHPAFVEETGEPTRGQFSVAAGPSLLLWSWDRRSTHPLGQIVSAVRLKSGVQWTPHRADHLNGPLKVDLGLTFRQ